MRCYNAFVLSLLILSFHASFANSVYPTNWWVGMKNPKLQLMLHGSNVAENTITIKYPGVKLEKIHKVESKNYVFIDVSISSSAKPGKLYIHLKKSNEEWNIPFELKARWKGKGEFFAQGVHSSDFIYLLMPDRFSNGDYTNDCMPGLKDQSLNRDSMYHRHGGDLQGVINHLDYLQDLGATALWMTPVFKNDMPDRTEHGYAITDHYTIEPRFGSYEAYKKLSDALHAKGMKLIQDAVYNHVGLYHFTIQDLPMKDWVHQWPKYTNTTYKDQPLMDVYASPSDKKLVSDGWFTTQMPDLNQSNPYVANFLIQHAIWSVEEFGVDGWRVDTYIYNDLNFMNRCNKALMDEYPKITIFGETWVHGVVNQAFFTQNKLDIPFKSNLAGVTDFQTNMYGIVPALTQKFGWMEGVNKLYQTLASDFIYANPMNHVVFLDNHDVSRFFSQIGENVNKQKMGIGWLLTTRGIPQMYYGTEILMKGFANPDGWVRLDFPGGWKEDKQNKFVATGRTQREEEVFQWTKTLANFRKHSSAIKTGKLRQYVPVDGVYVYCRYDNQQTVMCIMNTSEKEQEIDFSKYAERASGFTQARNVVSGEILQIVNSIKLPSYQILVLELMK